MSQTATTANPTESRVFVGNVPYQCNDDEFQQLFNGVSGYVSAQVVRRRNSTLSKGFGFVVLNSDEDASALIGSEQKFVIGDRELRVSVYTESEPSEARQRPQRPPCFQLFVGNLENGTTAEYLKDEFSEFGNVVDARVRTNETTQMSYGSVSYGTLEEYQNALNGSNRTVSPHRNQNRNQNRNQKQPRQNVQGSKPKMTYSSGYTSGQRVGYQRGFQEGYQSALRQASPSDSVVVST